MRRSKCRTVGERNPVAIYDDTTRKQCIPAAGGYTRYRLLHFGNRLRGEVVVLHHNRRGARRGGALACRSDSLHRPLDNLIDDAGHAGGCLVHERDRHDAGSYRSYKRHQKRQEKDLVLSEMLEVHCFFILTRFAVFEQSFLVLQRLQKLRVPRRAKVSGARPLLRVVAGGRALQ